MHQSTGWQFHVKLWKIFNKLNQQAKEKSNLISAFNRVAITEKKYSSW